MEHEAAQELFGGDRHLALLTAVSVVLPPEGNLAVGNGDETVIGDGDAMGISGQIVKYMLRPSEGAFCIDHPILAKERTKESMKGPLSGQCLEAAGKREFALTKGALQAGDKLAAKDAAQYLHGQEERVARMDPALMVWRQTTRGDHAVNVRMMLKSLAPGVEHTQKADLGTEMLGIGCHLQQSLGAGAKQEVVGDLLVLQNQPRKFVRQPFVCSFLKDHFGDGTVTLSNLCASDVTRFVQRQASHLHRKRAKLLTSALRSFLQYARYRGKTKLDLAAAVPTVANWSMSSIPRAIPADQVRQLLASIDRRTPAGCRDYAILLLLARLGLRSGEVASLELDNIDWNAGRLSARGKSGQRSELPLSAEVGEAIATYLRRGRPQSASRRVFLRVKAPKNIGRR